MKELRTFLRKGTRAVCRVSLGKWFYQPRVDAQDNVVPLKPVLGPLNQWLTERGRTPPWLMTREECHAYWQTLTNEDPRVDNRPEAYAASPHRLGRFLREFWSPEVRRTDRIMELGCNSGEHLHALQALGYTNLAGIEINPHAIEHLRRTFPEVAQRAAISCGSVETLLPAAATGSRDVLLTVAVLMHVHPTSARVFQEMVRVARKYLCVIETEAAHCSYVFARNYRRVFERLGCTQVRSLVLTKSSHPALDSRYYGCTARLFRAPREGPRAP